VSVVDVPFTAFRFEVILDLDTPAPGLESPLCDAAFAECDGLEITVEPKTIQAGGINDRQIHLVGPVKYAQLSLKRGMTSNLQLWTWFTLATQTGRVSTASGKVTMWDGSGNPAVEFTLTRCRPVKVRAPSLNAKDGLVAIEELGLVYEHLSVGLPGASGGLGLSAGISIGASASIGAGVNGGISVSGGVDLTASAGASVDLSATAGLG
jgi:phage tail-like protein